MFLKRGGHLGKLKNLFSVFGDSGGKSGASQPPPAQIDRKIQQCCKLSKSADSTFHRAFFFLPSHQRRALHVIYLFCRKVDDAVDEPDTKAEREKQLAGLEKKLIDSPDSEPLWPALAWVRDNFDIPLKYLEDLIKGARSDTGSVRLQSMEELETYCYRVAGTVGLVSLKVMEVPAEELRPQALQLARAFQVTNILRDVAEDYRRDRCYLPRSLLDKHNALNEWKNKRKGPGLSKVFNELAGYATENYNSAVGLLVRVGWRQRLTLAFMTAAYSHYLFRLKKEDFPVWQKKLSINKTKLPGLFLDSFLTLFGAPDKCLQIS
ncbi:MAG: phytoene/squalene synthase family protein [bacterium]